MFGILDRIKQFGSSGDGESGGGGSGDPSEDISASDPANYFAPEEAIWYKDKVVVNGKHARTYAIDGWPPSPRKHMFSGLLMNAQLDYDLAKHVDPYPDQEAIKMLDSLQDDLEDKRTGDFARFIPDAGSLQETEEIVDVMKNYINRGENLFDVTFYLTVYADSQEELEEAHSMVMNSLVRSANVSLTQCSLRQKEAMQSASPIGKDILGEKNDAITQKMLGSGVARTFPFVQDTFMEEDGVMFGVNEESMTPVIVDVFGRSNGYNMITSGTVGGGKTFSSSQVLLSMDTAYEDFRQFIIDPMGDFQGVVNCLGGERIVINGSVCLNPMEIQETPEKVIENSQGQVNPWSAKKDQLKWFFTQFFDGMGDEDAAGLSTDEISTLDTAITRTYNRFGITEDISTHHKESPTIMDLIETFEMMAENTEDYTKTDVEREMDKRERIAVDLLIAFDPFREGGQYHNLAQPTEVDITGDRTTYLDMQEIPENSDDLGVMMKLLFMQMYQEAKSTDDKVAITIDESHKIMRDGGVTAGLEEMFRHSRHFDLSINLISQEPEEFFSSETARTISNQCTIKRFHHVNHLNEEVAEDILDMNNSEINYIENAEMGEGKKDYSQALLQISDERMTIPLRIYATQDEAIVIDYEASEDVEAYSDPQSQSLKNALDLYNRTNVPNYVGDGDELSAQVAGQIAKKEQNRDQIVELVEQNEQAANGSGGGDERNPAIATSEPEEVGGVSGEGGQPFQNEAEQRRENLKRRLGDADGVDEESDNNISLIANQYDIADETDDVETIRKKLKSALFGRSYPDIDTSDTLTDTTEEAQTEVQAETNGGGGVASVVEEEPTSSDEPESGDAADTEQEEDGGGDGAGSDQDGGGDESEFTTEMENADTIEDISDERVETLYRQHVEEGSAASVAKKRAELKEVLS